MTWIERECSASEQVMGQVESDGKDRRAMPEKRTPTGGRRTGGRRFLRLTGVGRKTAGRIRFKALGGGAPEPNKPDMGHSCEDFQRSSCIADPRQTGNVAHLLMLRRNIHQVTKKYTKKRRPDGRTALFLTYSSSAAKRAAPD
ncbi:hypothetical protein [Stappia sp. ES.058]|uniref:hypothetical protein n=1 Tax=Stappia sp. ES.058 TaxID=1881061 RepID=UPI0012FD2EB6|nr:hypothetical protein [Stappia sp. ES.058]